jgi:hypothetical protein
MKNKVDVYDNVLSEKTLADINSFFIDKKEKIEWTTNHLFWPKYLNTHQGTILITMIRGNLKDTIYQELYDKDIIKDNIEITEGLFYQWLPGSSIAWHNDARVNDPGWQGCTIYLTDHWDSNWGGAYAWKDTKGSDRGHFIEPKFNRAVVLRDNVEHHVTTTSVFALPRTTLQLFYKISK